MPWEFCVSSVKRALRPEEKISSGSGFSGGGTMMRDVSIVTRVVVWGSWLVFPALRDLDEAASMWYKHPAFAREE